MKQTQRHDAIIELVKKQGYVSTEELVEHFSVSPQTIRRDLNDLADQNMILRHHGGAALPSSSVNTPWHDRKATQTAEKERIARKVATQIPNGSTLFIDIGTTPEAVAHALLSHSNLRIVTNNLNVANTLMVKEDFRIILAGGELRSRDGGIIGEATLSFLGLGAQPPTPEWGAMLNEARADMVMSPHVALFPALAIFLTVLAFNLLGDGLRDALDPKIKT